MASANDKISKQIGFSLFWGGQIMFVPQSEHEKRVQLICEAKDKLMESLSDLKEYNVMIQFPFKVTMSVRFFSDKHGAWQPQIIASMDPQYKTQMYEIRLFCMEEGYHAFCDALGYTALKDVKVLSYDEIVTELRRLYLLKNDDVVLSIQKAKD